jgi:hypothetical protein
MRRFGSITLAVSVFVLLFLPFLVPWAAPFAIRAYVAYAEWSFVRPSPPVETSFALPDGGIVRVTGTEIARVVLRITWNRRIHFVRMCGTRAISPRRRPPTNSSGRGRVAQA